MTEPSRDEELQAAYQTGRAHRDAELQAKPPPTPQEVAAHASGALAAGAALLSVIALFVAIAALVVALAT